MQLPRGCPQHAPANGPIPKHIQAALSGTQWVKREQREMRDMKLGGKVVGEIGEELWGRRGCF